MDNTRAAKLVCTGNDLEFKGAGTSPATPAVTIDGESRAAPSPMQMLLLATASCSASDVVLILKKMRQPPDRLEVEVLGTRREDDPRRFTAIRLVFEAAGAGLKEPALRRAVELSVEKYCSVIHTLAGDLDVSYELRVV